MARFDVYRGRDVDLYLDVQADRLSQLNTRVVIPLIPRATGFEAARKLNPIFRVDGHELVLATQYLAAIPVTRLGSV
ncbi:CcdB family protein [uncultured Devosia sp.]|uniref:CcdB family protein n=1 Tax=uncultured Devosia sp. TaxID=211434 RepID=UPI0035C9C38F